MAGSSSLKVESSSERGKWRVGDRAAGCKVVSLSICDSASEIREILFCCVFQWKRLAFKAPWSLTLLVLSFVAPLGG